MAQHHEVGGGPPEETGKLILPESFQPSRTIRNLNQRFFIQHRTPPPKNEVCTVTALDAPLQAALMLRLWRRIIAFVVMDQILFFYAMVRRHRRSRYRSKTLNVLS